VARRSSAAGRRPVKPPRGAVKRRARTQRTTVLLRWCVVGAAALVGFLYYQPVSSYVQTRASLSEREAEVRQLRSEKARLEQRLAESATVAALAREARRMSLVRPGERLFIVKGVREWRRSQAARGRDG
jgi:cell division protein FtsB